MEPVERLRGPSGPTARRLLERRMRELFRVYPKALVGDVDAVHDLRVAARRLRTALTLLAQNPEGRRARRADRALRDLARAAGRGRDLDVGLAILTAAPSMPDEGNRRLRRALIASRSRGRVLSREALLDGDLARARRDLRALAAGTRVDPAAFSERIAALRQREEAILGDALRTESGPPTPESLHVARRAARRLRYAAEVSSLFDGGDPSAADRWRTLQTSLGEIQDRHVLSLWLGSRADRAEAAGDVALATAAARALTRVKRDAARRTRTFLAAHGTTPTTA